MRAIQINAPGDIRAAELADPSPGPGQVLVRVSACGVCRTDLHLLDGELDIPRPPVVPGHQIVGTVIARGPEGGAYREKSAPEQGGPDPALAGSEPRGEPLEVGTRVGIPWLGWTCGVCRYCRAGLENLCVRARFTGRDIDGGYAELTVAWERYCLALPEGPSDLHMAPLLCAGLIGNRALRMTGEPREPGGEAQRLGLYGFGSSAVIVAQVARHEGRRVFAFTRPGDEAGQEFARAQGAEWAGGSEETPPEELDAAIIFAVAGELVPAALRATAPAGRVVCAGIHMSDIPSFPYEILWGERSVRSVANLTRADARELIALAPQVPIRTEVSGYTLEQAPQALEDLRRGRFRGAAVIDVAGSETGGS